MGRLEESAPGAQAVESVAGGEEVSQSVLLEEQAREREAGE